MRMKRILSGLLVVVMVLSMMTMNVFAADSDKVVLSDVSYDYGVIPFSKEVGFMSFEKQKEIFSIDKNIAKTLTTEALLETILNNPFFIDFLAYEDFSLAVKSKDKDFCISELLSREDINTILIRYRNIYSDSLELFNQNVSLVRIGEITFDKVSEEDFTYALNVAKFSFIEELLKYNLNEDIFSHSLRENRDTEYVKTKNNKLVPCLLNQTYSEYGKSQAQLVAENLVLLAAHQIADIVEGGVSVLYNCHSYAWYSQNTATNNAWIPYPEKFIDEAAWVGNMSAVGIGTKVTYFNTTDGKYEHSAIVAEMNSNGTVKRVISKWGPYSLMIHSIANCPYNAQAIEYWNY